MRLHILFFTLVLGFQDPPPQNPERTRPDLASDINRLNPKIAKTAADYWAEWLALEIEVWSVRLPQVQNAMDPRLGDEIGRVQSKMEEYYRAQLELVARYEDFVKTDKIPRLQQRIETLAQEIRDLSSARERIEEAMGTTRSMLAENPGNEILSSINKAEEGFARDLDEINKKTEIRKAEQEKIRIEIQVLLSTLATTRGEFTAQRTRWRAYYDDALAAEQSRRK